MNFITRSLTVLSLLAAFIAQSAPPDVSAGTAANASLVAQLPIAFEENAGQTDARAKFLLRAPGYTAFFNEREVIFSFRHSERQVVHRRTHRRTVGKSVVQISLVGSSPHAVLNGAEELPGRANYLIGSNPDHWRTDVPTFARLTAADVYPGIDLTYYGSARDLEYDFIVRPGADPSDIRLRSEGGSRMLVDPEGRLRITIDGDEIARWRAPIAYQEFDGVRKTVACEFVLHGMREVAFAIGDYDHSVPLVIDPVLLYSSFLGGSGADAIEAVTVVSNSVYVVGETTSLNFPSPGGFRTNAYDSNDVFVARFNSNGTALIFSTYLGGTGEDFGNSIAVDGNGNVCITGGTESPNFPLKNQFQSGLSGVGDAFVTKLSSAGNALLYSSYLGGNSYEAGNAVTVGNGGNIYVAGETESGAQFPKKSPVQNNAGGLLDGFIARFNPTVSGGSSLVFSSWLGGSDDDRATGIDIDGSHFYVAGEVYALDFFSSDFPVKNAFQPEYGGGGSDAWLAKLPLAASSVSWATYLGGEFEDVASSVVVDTSGNLYLVGSTVSGNFPTLNAQQSVLGGSGFSYTSDAFATKIAGNGTNILFSTFFGGEQEEKGSGIGVDANGMIYITGQTSSSDLPVSTGSIQPTYNGGPGDAFVAKLNPSVPRRNGVVYSTYFGGIGTEDPGEGNCIFVTTNGDFYFVGTTTSTNGFPSENAFAGVFGGGYSDAFIAKLASQPDLCVSVSASIEPVLVGSNLTYTFRVNNSSRSNFTGVTLTNILPPSVNYLSAAASRGTVTRDGQTVVWSIGTITNHGAGTLTLSVQTTTPGLITNSARLTAAEPEVNSGNNEDSTVSTVRGIADLIITKTATPNPVFASSNLSYSIIVSNAGPWNASSVDIFNELPAGSAFVSAITTRGFLDIEDGYLTCFLPVLTNGGAVAINLIVAPQAGVITNVGEVFAFELDLFTNNLATNITTVDPVSELVLTLASSVQDIFVTSNITYTVAVSNRGPSTATSVVITNVLPPNVAFISAGLPNGSDSHANGIVTGTLSSLAKGQQRTLTIVARGQDAATGTNSAGVRSANYDPILENNSSSIQTTVRPLANVALSGSATPPTPYSGQQFTMTFTAQNLGPSPASNVIITATLPPSVAVASANSPQGSCTVNGSTVVCTVSALNSNDVADVIINAVPSVGGFTLTHATVANDVTDPIVANNSAIATVQVIQSPQLFIRRYSTDHVAVTWPAVFSNFIPEFTITYPFPMTTGLVQWSAVTNPIVMTNGLNTFTNFFPDETKTFRLRQLSP